MSQEIQRSSSEVALKRNLEKFEVSKFEDYLDDFDRPSIVKRISAHGDDEQAKLKEFQLVAAEVVEIIHTEFVEVVSKPGKPCWSGGVTNKIAAKLITEYKQFRIEDIYLFCDKARSGELGKFIYMNMPEFLQMWQTFLVERMMHCEDLNQRKKIEAETEMESAAPEFVDRLLDGYFQRLEEKEKQKRLQKKSKSVIFNDKRTIAELEADMVEKVEKINKKGRQEIKP